MYSNHPLYFRQILHTDCLLPLLQPVCNAWQPDNWVHQEGKLFWTPWWWLPSNGVLTVAKQQNRVLTIAKQQGSHHCLFPCTVAAWPRLRMGAYHPPRPFHPFLHVLQLPSYWACPACVDRQWLRVCHWCHRHGLHQRLLQQPDHDVRA